MIRTWNCVRAKVGSRFSGPLLGLMAFGAVCLFSASRAEAQIYMYGQTNVTPGRNPEALVVGDFNGDGKLDLAVVNEGDDTISVFLATADGSFAAKVDYAVGHEPVQIVTGDFNGDGKQDLAVVNQGNNTLSILMGVGDGTFQAQVTYPTGALPNGIATADFDGDKKLDLAVTNAGDGTISLLFGEGDGTFQVQSPTIPASPSPHGIAAHDMNGDGKADLLVLTGPDSITGGDTLSVLLNSGNGTFTSTTLIFRPGFGAIAVGDLNHDGIPDMAVTSTESVEVYVFLGDGHGNFQISDLDVTNGNGGSPSALTLADFNHDGNLDLAVTEGGFVAVYPGNGDGSFRGSQLAGFPFGIGAPAIAAGDFNLDGLPDVAVVLQLANTVSIFLGNGDGSLGSHQDVTLPTSGGLGAAVLTDLNGDGKKDVAVSQYNQPATTPIQGFMTTVLGNQDGTFKPASAGATSDIGIITMVAGDFNGDGKTDIATADVDSNEGVAVFLNTGGGSFGAPISSFTGIGGLNVQPMVAGDFNGDGKSDLAVVSENQSSPNRSPLYILLSNGDGTFQENFLYNLTYGQVPGLATADLNGDGKVDLVACDSGQVFVFVGRGDGTFLAPAMYPANSNFSGSVLIGDFNRDGKLDIVTVTDKISFLQGVGDGTFKPAVVSPSGGLNGIGMTEGDFNGDGNLDIAFEGTGTNIILGNGDGTFHGAFFFDGTYFARPAFAAGDINGDGTFDLVEFSTSDTTQAVPQTMTVMSSVPSVSFSASSIRFPSQAVNSTSGAVPLTLSNVGNAPLKIASMSTTGDFGETNDCGSTLDVGKSCTIEVRFGPVATDVRNGSLIIVDNTPSNGQVIALSGLATAPPPTPDFTIDVPQPSNSVTAGGSTSYALTITPTGGFGGTVQLTCTGAPSGATCSVTPSTVPGATVSNVTVNVTTTAASFVGPLADFDGMKNRRLPGIWVVLAGFALVYLITAFSIGRSGRSLRIAGFVFGALALTVASGCGGGSSGSAPPPSNPGTAAGTYTLTVTGSSRSLTHSVKLTLIVK